MILRFSSFWANKLLEFTKRGRKWPSPIPLSQIISCTTHKTSELKKKKKEEARGRETDSLICWSFSSFPSGWKGGTRASEELLCVVLKTNAQTEFLKQRRSGCAWVLQWWRVASGGLQVGVTALWLIKNPPPKPCWVFHFTVHYPPCLCVLVSRACVDANLKRCPDVFLLCRMSVIIV